MGARLVTVLMASRCGVWAAHGGASMAGHAVAAGRRVPLGCEGRGVRASAAGGGPCVSGRDALPDAGAGWPLVRVRKRARDHAALQRVSQPIVPALLVSAACDVAGAAGTAAAGVRASPRDLHD